MQFGLSFREATAAHLIPDAQHLRELRRHPGVHLRVACDGVQRRRECGRRGLVTGAHHVVHILPQLGVGQRRQVVRAILRLRSAKSWMSCQCKTNRRFDGRGATCTIEGVAAWIEPQVWKRSALKWITCASSSTSSKSPLRSSPRASASLQQTGGWSRVNGQSGLRTSIAAGISNSSGGGSFRARPRFPTQRNPCGSVDVC